MSSVAPVGGGDRQVLTTCPRDCYDACGVEVLVRDGRIHHVRGDPEHPVSRGKLCRKCTAAYNGALIDPDARLKVPLLRDGPKGSGRWREASWEEATALIASRLTEIVDGPGAATILATHYTGTFALLGYGFPLRFINRLGAREVDPDTICNKAGHVALDYLYGSSLDGFDPRAAADAACILVWGANPSSSAPHQHDHWLPEAPGTVIVVDPVRTATAAAADLHLQPFPGSDAALAFTIAHVIRRKGLIDREMLDGHAVGLDELEALIEPCTPDWGERVTGVPADVIERAAVIYGSGPSLLWLGQGFQRQPMGGNAVRAVGQLAALSGNLGRPGTGFLYLNGAHSRGIDEDYVVAPSLMREPVDAVSHMDLVDTLEDPSLSQALICWNINIAASNPEQARLRRALAREDLFTVVAELFETDTTDLADVVLPAASFLESDDLVASYFHLSLGAQVKAADPIGLALPNSEIFRRLAAAMGYTEPELFESDRGAIDHLLARSGTGLDFDTLARVGTVWPDAEPRIQFSDLHFGTPSGKIEFASAAAAADGHPRMPEPHTDERPADGRLRLLSPASRWMMNYSFANERKLKGRAGAATIVLHPDDADERGLVSGAPALVGNEIGSLTLEVALDETLPRGVAFSAKGRWPRSEPSGANVNALNPGTRSDMGDSSSVHGIEVTISAVP